MISASVQESHGHANGRAEPPTPNSTHSYWHRDPSKRLMGHRTTSDLLPTTDVVIVGSGITGTFAAQELVSNYRRVVMLEAREACWGATGRNGGHCQPGVWDSPTEVARFELATFNLIKDLVAKNNIPCDWQIIGGVHAIFSPEMLEAAKKQINRLQQHPDLKDKAILIQDKNELARMHVPNALAAIYQPDAAKCWPYKLVTWVLERLLDQHSATAFNLQTNTVVDRLQRCETSWAVHTQRGQIKAKDVLLASNAYTSYLLPGMTGLILPVRGQVCALEPPPGATQLLHSYVWMKDADHQYLIQRGPEDTEVDDGGKIPHSRDRSLILGGERQTVPGGEEGISRDDEINPIISHALHRGLNGALTLDPESENGTEHKFENQALHASYEWTGIMGYSRDSSPWVGRVPGPLLDELIADSDSVEADVGSLWISAGYTGHGMPVAARCGIAVAEMILGKESDIQVPKQWIVSGERIKKARGMTLHQTLDDVIKDLPVE